MSIQAMGWVFGLELPHPGQKLTLLALANYADPEGICRPGQPRLAKDTSQGERTVRRHLAELEEAGLIERSRRIRQDGSRTSDEYHLKFQPANLAAGNGGQPATVAGGQPANLAEPTGHGGRAMNRKGNRQVDEPSDSESSGLSSDDDGARDIASKMVATYHERCPSLTKVLEFGPPRRAAALARFRDLGGMMSNWEAYCDQIEASDFLAGRKTDFVAGWDFITKKANYVKVMEGRYVNRGQKGGSGKSAEAAYRDALAGVPRGSDQSS